MQNQLLPYSYDALDSLDKETKTFTVKQQNLLYNTLLYAPAMLFTLKCPEFTFIFANLRFEKFCGKQNVIGKSLKEVFPQLQDQGYFEILNKVCATGEAYTGTEMRLLIEQGGKKTTRYINFNCQPFYNDNKLEEISVFAYDVTEQVKTRLQLEQTAEMIENLYMNAPAFVSTLKGPEFIFELVNPQFQKIYGKRKLVGLKIIDALPELKNTAIIPLLQKVYTTGTPFVGTEMRLLLSRDEGKEPEPTYFNFSYQPMYNLDKEIDGILVFGYEVTEQVLTKNKSEENLKRLLESLPQITSTSSAEGTNIFFNKFFFEYSGLSVEEAKTEGWNAIVHPDDIEDVLRDWELCKKKGKDFYKEIRLRRKTDGMYRWHIARITAIRDDKNEVCQWIASATDIHEQKIKEQKKDEFLSIASHELKTPLTTVKAYLQLLEMSVEKNNKNATLYTKKAILSVERLKDLISELLDVSKIQNGKLNFNFSTFDFNEMIISAIEDIQYNSPNHRIIKTGKIAKPVFGDKERLQQVMINLLSNAVKYSPDSQEVYITISEEQDQIQVAVKDNGIGIAKNNLEKIFERYFRIEGQQLHFQGLGIGLFISMEIIKRHNGKVWAESEEGKGSTFYFTLPVDQKMDLNTNKTIKN